jgi:sulfide dehydrogenase [flavocytochrome c] flavoprotein chain
MGVMRRREFLGAGSLALAALPCAPLRSATAPVVIIVGAGFAGSRCALALRHLDPGVRVLLFDGRSDYHTCPMSNEALVGLRTLASLAVSRAGLKGTGVEYSRAAIAAIDPAKRTVQLQDGASLAWDRLVVAPGIRMLAGDPEGYDEAAALRMPHAWEAGPLTDLLARYLAAVPDGGTVAISVPAGLMRCPPAPYERASLIAEYLMRRRRRCKLLIFDANNHFPRQDVFTAAWAQLYPGVIEWIAPNDGGAITRVDPGTNTLYSTSGAHRVALASVIPRQAPGALALASGLCSGHGWCPVKAATFESELLPDVYVIGDACIAGAMPKSASAARGQAQQCAAAILASLAGRPPPQPALASVCYSMVSASSALAIRAEFELRQDELQQIAGNADVTPSSAHAHEASAWYRDMRASCFAD